MTRNYMLEPRVKFDCKQGHGQADSGDKLSSSQTMLSRGYIMLASGKPVLATSSSQNRFCCGDMLTRKIYYVIPKRRANKPSSRKLSS